MFRLTFPQTLPLVLPLGGSQGIQRPVIPPTLMDTIMLKHGVCCGHIVTGTEVQQQNTTWVQIGETIPLNHIPSGNTVAAHVSVEVSLVGAPSSTSPTASKKYSALLYRPLR